MRDQPGNIEINDAPVLGVREPDNKGISQETGSSVDSLVIKKLGAIHQVDLSFTNNAKDGEYFINSAENDFSIKLHLRAGQLSLEVSPDTAAISVVGSLSCTQLHVQSKGSVNLGITADRMSTLDVKAHKIVVAKPLVNCQSIRLGSDGLIVLGAPITASNVNLSAQRIHSEAALTADTANFKATQALAIKSPLIVKELSLEAPSIVQSSSIKADKVEIKAGKRLVNRGHIYANDSLEIAGEHFVNRGHCYSPHTASLDVKEYLAESGSSLRGQTMLQITANRWMNRGECISDSNAFIKVDQLENRSRISLNGEFYCHAKSLAALAGSRLSSSKADGLADDTCRQIKVDEILDVELSASLELGETYFSLKNANISGKFLTKSSFISMKNCVLNNGSESKFMGSKIDCDQKLNLKEGSSCRLESTVFDTNEQIIDGLLAVDSSSSMRSKETIQIRSKGVVEIDSGELRAFRLNNFGKIQATHRSLLNIGRTVWLQDGSTLVLEGNSRLKSSNAIACAGSGASIRVKGGGVKAKVMELAGDIDFDHAEIKSGRATFKNKFSAQKTSFFVDQLLSLVSTSGETDLESCLVKAELFEVDGALKADKSKIHSHVTTLKPKSIFQLTNAARLDTNSLIVQDQSEFIISKNATLDAKVVAADGKIFCERSKLNAECLESARGEIYFKEAEIHAPGFMRSAGKSEFDRSVVNGASVKMTGHYNIATSKLTCDYLIESGTGVIDASEVIVTKQHRITEGAKVSLTGDTHFLSHTSQISGDLTSLGGSFRATNLLQDRAKIDLKRTEFEVEALARSLAGSSFTARESDIKLEKAMMNGAIDSEGNRVTAGDLLVGSDARFVGGSLTARGHLGLTAGQHDFKYTQVTADSISAAGKLLVKGSDMESKSEFVVSGEAHAEYSKIKADKVSLPGKFKIIHSTLDAEELMAHNHLTHKASAIRVTGKFEVGALATHDSEDSTIHAKQVRLGGRGTLKSTSIEAEDSVSVGSAASLRVDGVRIKTAGRVDADSGAKVTGDALEISADTFDNSGEFSVSKLKVDVEYLRNYGFLGGEQVKIEANKLLFNSPGSRITGATTHIMAGAIINTAAHINGSNTLTMNSFFNLNVGGVYSGFNVANNNLVGINAGLMLPSIPTSWDAVTDPMRWVRMGGMMATTLVPQYGAAISLATATIPVLWSIGKTVYRGEVNKTLAEGAASFHQLVSKARNLPTDIWTCKAKDVLTTALAVKNLAMPLASVIQGVGGAYGEFSEAPSIDWDFSHLEDMSLALAAIAPTNYSASVFSLNAGFEASGSVGGMSFYSANTGVEAGAMLTNTSTHIFNGGALFGSTITEVGSRFDNSGLVIGDRVSLSISEEIHNAQRATILAKRATVQTGEFTTEGQIFVDEEGRLIAHTYRQGHEAHSEFHRVVEEVDVHAIDGDLSWLDSQVVIRESASFAEGSTVSADHTAISAGAMALNGQFTAAHSHLHSESTLTIGKSSSAQAVDTALTADDASIAGSVDLTNSALSAKKTVFISKTGSVKVVGGNVETQALTSEGGLDANSATLLISQALNTAAGSKTAFKDSYVQANSHTVSGDETVEHSTVKVKGSSSVDEGASLNLSEGSSWETNSLSNSGNTAAAGSSIAAAEAFVTKGTGVTVLKDSIAEAGTHRVAGSETAEHSAVKVKGSSSVDEGASLNLSEGSSWEANSLSTSGNTSVAGSSMAVAKAFVTEEAGVTVLKDSIAEAGTHTVAGSETAEHSAVTVAEDVTVTEQGSLKLAGGTGLEAARFSNAGNASTKDSSVSIAETFSTEKSGSTMMIDSALTTNKLLSSGAVALEHSAAVAEAITVTGGAALSASGGSSVETQEFDNAGTASLVESSLSASKRFDTAAGGETRATASVIEAGAVNDAGSMILRGSALTSRDTTAVKAGASFTATDESGVETRTFSNDGSSEFSRASLRVAAELSAGAGSSTRTEDALVEAGSASIAGALDATGSDFKVADSLNLEEKSKVTAHDTAMSGRRVVIDGEFDADQTYVEAAEDLGLSETAVLNTHNVGMKAAKVTHAADHAFTGDFALEADLVETAEGSNIHQVLTPDGTTDQNILAIRAREAALAGQSNSGSLVLEVDHIADAAALVQGSGAGARMETTDSFALITKGPVALEKIQRTGDLRVTADSVDLKKGFTDKEHDLSLTATTGSVTLQSEVNTHDIAVRAAGNITNTADTHASGDASYQAQREFRTIGADIIAEKTLSVSAHDVRVITRDSEAFKHLADEGVSPDAIAAAGAGGSLEGGTTLIEAGNDIDNDGGIISGVDYAQMIAGHDINSIVNELIKHGQYDTEVAYASALISGGGGREGDEQHVGIYISAGHKVHNDASAIVADGTVYVEAKEGFDSTARSHTYVSYHNVKKGGFFGGKKETTTWTTEVGESTLASTDGKIIMSAEAGGMSFVSTAVMSAKGSEMDARDSINFAALKTIDRSETHKSGIFGLNKSSHSTYDEGAAMTIIATMEGVTRIHSAEGDIISQGTSFIGDADVVIEASNGSITMISIILNHHEHIKERHVFANSGAFDMAKAAVTNPGSLVTELLPLAGAVSKAFDARHPVEIAAALTNLMVEAKAASELAKQGALLKPFMDKLSFAEIGMSSTTTDIQYQTKTEDSIQALNLRMKAGKKINTAGVDISASGDARFEAEEIRMAGMGLESSVEQTQQSVAVSLSVLPVGGAGIQDVSASSSHMESHSTTQAHAHIRVAGEATLIADTATLDDASIDAGSVRGVVEHLDIISRQDTSSSSATSTSLSAAGSAAFSSSHSEARVVHEQSGIHAHTGINPDAEHSFDVGTAHIVGGYVTTDRPEENHFKPAILEAEELHDYEKGSSIGFSGNVAHMVDALRHPDAALNSEAGINPLENFTVTTGADDYSATHHATVSSDLDGTEIHGPINRTSVTAPTVESDSHYMADFKIPVTAIAQAAKTAGAVAESIHSHMASMHPATEQARPAPEASVDTVEAVSGDSQEVVIPSAKPPAIAQQEGSEDSAKGDGTQVSNDARGNTGYPAAEERKSSGGFIVSEEIDVVDATIPIVIKYETSSEINYPEIIMGFNNFSMEADAHYLSRYSLFPTQKTVFEDGSLELSANLASMNSDGKCVISRGNGRYSGEVSADFGLKGPTAIFKYVQNFDIGSYIRGLFTSETEVGVGLHATLGMGFNFDTVQDRFKIYWQAGLFAGAGVRTHESIELWLDPELVGRLEHIESMRDSHVGRLYK